MTIMPPPVMTFARPNPVTIAALSAGTFFHVEKIAIRIIKSAATTIPTVIKTSGIIILPSLIQMHGHLFRVLHRANGTDALVRVYPYHKDSLPNGENILLHPWGQLCAECHLTADGAEHGDRPNKILTDLQFYNSLLPF